LTEDLGYDGGAFYSPDGRQIVYRAMHPQAPDAIEDYKRLLANHLVRPSRLELWVMDADGRNKRQLTSLGVASFAPYFHPSGKKVIFASNHPDVRSREFDLWMINLDGTGLEQITYSAGFDGFPMFSPDGKQLVFCSNRNNSKPGETNVFLADWVD
jgi:Tol biopolymer transport system component